MKRTALALAAAVAALAVFAVVASAAPKTSALVIRHQLHGCHAWSLNGGPYKATQKVQLARGGTLLVTDNDVMSHQLVKLSGPAIAVKLVSPGAMGAGMMKNESAAGMMGRMGATIRVTFPAKGTYVFRTKAGEDYVKGITTVGEDNVLRLTVTVS
jgi:hypothetical protein